MRIIALLLLCVSIVQAGNKCLRFDASFSAAAKRNAVLTTINSRSADFLDDKRQFIRSYSVTSSTLTNSSDIQVAVWFKDTAKYESMVATIISYLNNQAAYIVRGSLTQHTCPDTDTLSGQCAPCVEEVLWSK